MQSIPFQLKQIVSQMILYSSINPTLWPINVGNVSMNDKQSTNSFIRQQHLIRYTSPFEEK